MGNVTPKRMSALSGIVDWQRVASALDHAEGVARCRAVTGWPEERAAALANPGATADLVMAGAPLEDADRMAAAGMTGEAYASITRTLRAEKIRHIRAERLAGMPRWRRWGARAWDSAASAGWRMWYWLAYDSRVAWR